MSILSPLPKVAELIWLSVGSAQKGLTGAVWVSKLKNDGEARHLF